MVSHRWTAGRRLGLSVLSALLSAPLVAESIVFIDDRERPIEAALEVCFVRGLETDCADVAPSAQAEVAWRVFDLLRVEGPEHGPVSVKPAALGRPGSPGYAVVVPRKALLRIAGGAGGGTLSLYPVDDPQVRQPGFREEIRSEGEEPAEVRVPAGEHLLSIARGRAAPDLHALIAAPGEIQSLRYRERSGWSLALRVVDPVDGSAVPGAEVVLRAPPGVNGDAPELPRARSGPLGFAIVRGLTAPMVHVAVRHPGFVETEALGLSAAPGTFDLHHAEMERGGSVLARVTLGGVPAAGATCRLVASAGTDAERFPVVETLAEAVADAEGACRFDHVRSGTRHLRVGLPARTRSAVVDRELYVVEGETTLEEIDLSPIRLTGTVYRGAETAGAGYEVLVVPVRAEGPAGTQDPVLRAPTDAEGRYAGELWEPGEYFFLVAGPTRTAGRSTRAFLSAPEEEQDFHLSGREIRGRVVGADGEPVSEAAVSLTWEQRSHAGTVTDERGEFAFALTHDDGEATLVARRPWGPPGPPERLTVAPGAPLPSVVLRVPEDHRVSGLLEAASGVPVTGGQVWSYRPAETGVPILLGRDVTGADGAFEVPAAPDGETWIYAGAPGCPLDLHVVPIVREGQTLSVRCAETPAALRLHLLNGAGDGDGLSGQTVLLRRGGRVVPGDVVAEHLASLGLAASSDPRGRLVLAGVAPGDYDLFLGQASNEYTVAQGMRHGFLASATLAPLTSTDLEIVVDEGL